MALLTRRGAGVVGAARELDLQAQPRGQARDHPGRPLRGGDVARLVDVQLEEAGQPVEPLGRARQPRRVDARTRHRVAERDPVIVHARERVVDVEPPGQRAGAERRRVEARALLVGERDDRHRQALGDREAGGDPERAVEAPARAHGVEVRADRPPGPGASGQAHRFPAGSRSSRRPIAAARRANQPAACSSSSVHASRVVAPLLVEPDRHEIREQRLELGGGDHAYGGHAAITSVTGLRPKR